MICPECKAEVTAVVGLVNTATGGKVVRCGCGLEWLTREVDGVEVPETPPDENTIKSREAVQDRSKPELNCDECGDSQDVPHLYKKPKARDGVPYLCYGCGRQRVRTKKQALTEALAVGGQR